MRVAMLSVSGACVWSIPTMEHRSMININSGTFNQLKSLVGIGDTYAKRIVEGRPYQRTDELVTKNILPQTNYDRIKEHIMTRPK
jgi:competence protein ComEA